MNSSKSIAIIVLSDGSTWETLGGQAIKVISAEDYERLCADKLSAKELRNFSTYDVISVDSR